jgi:hypothetical protein
MRQVTFSAACEALNPYEWSVFAGPAPRIRIRGRHGSLNALIQSSKIWSGEFFRNLSTARLCLWVEPGFPPCTAIAGK